MIETKDIREMKLVIMEAQNGNREAFNEVMRNYYRFVWAIAYSILKNAELIEEAVQETFIKVYKQFKYLDSVGSFPSWLSAIARNVSIDLRRKEQRRKAAQIALQEKMNSVTDTERKEKKQILKELMNELPEKYRIPLILKYIHGMNNVEIAGLTAQTEPAIRGILYRGRAMLKALYDSEMDLRKNQKEEVKDE